MKLYTDESQTAKLIELGFPRPRIDAGVTKWEGYEPICTGSYTLGELIAILPSTVGKDYDLHIEFSVTKWYVAYYWIGNGGEYYIKYEFSACELIDTLYMMILKLKEEGVI